MAQPHIMLGPQKATSAARQRQNLCMGQHCCLSHRARAQLLSQHQCSLGKLQQQYLGGFWQPDQPEWDGSQQLHAPLGSFRRGASPICLLIRPPDAVPQATKKCLQQGAAAWDSRCHQKPCLSPNHLSPPQILMRDPTGSRYRLRQEGMQQGLLVMCSAMAAVLGRLEEGAVSRPEPWTSRAVSTPESWRVDSNTACAANACLMMTTLGQTILG